MFLSWHRFGKFTWFNLSLTKDLKWNLDILWSNSNLFFPQTGSVQICNGGEISLVPVTLFDQARNASSRPPQGKVAQTACMSACKHISTSLMQLPLEPEVRQISIGALHQLQVDVNECESEHHRTKLYLRLCFLLFFISLQNTKLYWFKVHSRIKYSEEWIKCWRYLGGHAPKHDDLFLWARNNRFQQNIFFNLMFEPQQV